VRLAIWSRERNGNALKPDWEGKRRGMSKDARLVKGKGGLVTGAPKDCISRARHGAGGKRIAKKKKKNLETPSPF